MLDNFVSHCTLHSATIIENLGEYQVEIGIDNDDIVEGNVYVHS